MKYLKLYENFDFEETWIQDEEYYKFKKGDIVKCKNPNVVFYYNIDKDIDFLNRTYNENNWDSPIIFDSKDCLVTDVGILNGIDVIQIRTYDSDEEYWPWFKAEFFELSK